ncbi:THAP domain-containing protein, partial [Temnothorax longispinosus]
MPTEVEERQEEDYLTCSLSTTDKATMAQPSMEDKTTMTSSVYNSPEKCRLRKQLLYQKEKYDKKIRGLQQTVRRRDKQVVTLKCILDTLRKKGILEAEQSEMLLNLGGSNELFKRLCKKQKNERVPRQYNPQLRVFALTLHYYSPRAYEYVRRHFNLCLPHTKTISSWYKTINGNTGISTEALESIKNRVQNTNYTLCGSTSFPHPITKEKVVTFFDPCHMLKLVRNTFGDSKILLDVNNNFVQWSHITELHDIQESEGMHLGNKLRNAHINYSKQKMKVRLATQIFSKSVADALSFCKNDMQLEQFHSCEATIQFLSIFNDLFDILNSRNMHQLGFKKALNSSNLALIK